MVILVEHARHFQNTPESMLDSFRFVGQIFSEIHPCMASVDLGVLQQ